MQLPRWNFAGYALAMAPLVECVPNFSEGRDLAKIQAIAQAMEGTGVYLLDQHVDADHNRCVITIAGDPGAVQEAAVRGVGKAAELIDLNLHRGVHPRLGAADVVPFVPVAGITLEECAEIARCAGAEIWKRYGIPVYLYEAAAALHDRRRLENIRRGQFEGLGEEIARDPARRPDFGKAKLHSTAGAVVVGARKFLIAYNIFLNTADVQIAKRIAQTVRASGGGLPCVKAAGFLVRGKAQVSMNLTDFEQTPIHKVYEAVEKEALRYGAKPESNEFIGLIPQRTVDLSAQWFARQKDFDSSIILENRLAAIAGRMDRAAF